MIDFKTFIDSKDIEKQNEFYKNGFFACNMMYIMEREIPKYIDTSDIENPFITRYDTSDLTEYLKANAKGFGTQDPIEKIMSDVNKPGSAIYVYRVNGKIASSVTVWDEGQDAIATENIFTVPKYRGKGYATAVLQVALIDAFKRGRLKSKLSVYAGDVYAIKMYYKFGYEITRVLQEFVHE